MVKKKILECRDKDYKFFQELTIETGREELNFSRDRCKELTPKLKKKEPRSIFNYLETVKRAHKYITSSFENNITWFPLNFHPPLLLFPIPH